MKEEIIKLSKNIGIDDIGFCNIKNLIVDYEKYKKQEALNYKCSFQVGNIDDKDLSNIKYSKYNSIICICVGYKKVNFSDENKVYVSSFAVNKDYHKVLKDKLKIINDYLFENGFISEIFVDNNSLDEKNLAYNCGLGFFGKNNLLINKKLGSYFNIGVILTDAYLERDKIVSFDCGKCNKCIKECPTGALNNNGILDAKKCLSYLTQSKKIDVSEEKYFNNCIYGCDKCISICPYNRNIDYYNEDGININDFLNMDNKYYNEKYKDSAFIWRGKNVLDRNINIYLKNIDKK